MGLNLVTRVDYLALWSNYGSETRGQSHMNEQARYNDATTIHHHHKNLVALDVYDASNAGESFSRHHSPFVLKEVIHGGLHHECKKTKNKTSIMTLIFDHSFLCDKQTSTFHQFAERFFPRFYQKIDVDLLFHLFIPLLVVRLPQMSGNYFRSIGSHAKRAASAHIVCLTSTQGRPTS